MTMENVEDVYPLSPIQEGMLYHSIRAPGSGTFVEQYCCSLSGPLDVAYFRAAWADVVQAHGALRTSFLWDGLDEPLQVVRRTVELDWALEDWRPLEPEALELRWEAFLRSDRHRPLEVGRAPVMRMALVRVGEDVWRFVWTFHHLLSDGWSTPLVLGDVWTAYAAHRAGAPVRLAAPRPYRDYIEWLQRQDPSRAASFWRDQLAGVSAATPLSVDGFGAPRRQGHARHELALSPSVTSALVEAGRGLRVTLNTLVQGAWALLLHRYSGENDVVFGTTDAGRPTDLDGVERMIGLFISTLPVRVSVEPDQAAGPWLRELQSRLVSLRPNAYTPLVDIQRASEVPAGQPLFESLVVFENYPEPPSRGPAAHGIEITEVRYLEQSNFPLALLALPGTSLRFIVVYDSSRFDDDVIVRLGQHLTVLLEGLASSPASRLRDLPILPEAERRVVMGAAEPKKAAEAASKTRAGTVLDLIDRSVNGRPDTEAAVFEKEPLSYEELGRRSDVLARVLVEAGVRRDVPVGLCTERSLEMVVGLIGILRAGGAYVPLDPAYPLDRLRFMLEDADARVVVADRASAGVLADTDARIVILDDSGETSAAGLPLRALPDPHPSSLAYLMYTSGSTGRPKGVAVTHGNLLASTLARDHHYAEPVQRFLLLSSLSFDSSVAGLFWTLTTGGTLVLPRTGQEQDLRGLAALIQRQRVTHTLTLPSLYALLLEHEAEALSSLRVVAVAGEACPAHLVDRHHRSLPTTELHNEYGPTEATVWCSAHRTAAQDGRGPVPIGHPILGARLYVLDPHGRPTPVGVPGELYVGGAGLARGYHNRPDETSRRFVASPVEGSPDARLYRTGDRVRRRPDGTLEFLGRADRQIKIRGQRVEPDEVAVALERHPEVREAAVIGHRPDGRAAAELVAYVAPATHGTGEELRAFLGDRLPDVMVPSRVVALPALPRLPNGKLDLQALPVPDRPGAPADAARVEPRTPAEQVLAKVWSDVLRLERVGVHDHFFELGGDSILSIQVISRIRQHGLRVTPSDLFEHPTIAELAQFVRSEPAPDEDQGVVRGALPLAPVQRWFFETHRAAPHHWNQALRLDAQTFVDGEALRAAVRCIVGHHDGLRTAFRRSSDGWSAEVTEPTEALRFEAVDLSDLPPDGQERAVVAATDRAHAGFELSDPPLFRVLLFDRGSERSSVIVLVAHHLVVDAVSWRILVEDLSTAYRALASGEEASLGSKTVSFKRWTEHLLAEAGTPRVQAELPFWEAQESGAYPLPVDRESSTPATEATALGITVALDQGRTRALQTDALKAYNSRVNEMILAALARAVAAWTGTPTVVVDVEIHGRSPVGEGIPALDVSRTVGWFTATHPLRLILPPADPADPAATIKTVKEQLRGVPGRGVGYGLLRYSTRLGRGEVDRSRRPGLLFNYLGDLDRARPEIEPFRIRGYVKAGARSLLSERPYPIEVNAFITEGELAFEWTFDSGRYERTTIERLARTTVSALSDLVAHCAAEGSGGYTPSDFPEAGMSQSELDRLLGGIG